MNSDLMRLLTHNTLKCAVKGVAAGYPLQLQVDEFNVVESECNLDFIRHILPSLHWGAILVAAEAVKLEGFPSEFSPALLEDEDFLEAVHNLLIDIHVVTGRLVCPETGRVFPIENGIPNMM